jgi:hypothetical protein
VSAVRLREAKGRLSYKRGGEELKGKNKNENRRERGRSQPPVSSFQLTNLFITIFIGLNYLLFYFMFHVWTEDMFLFSLQFSVLYRYFLF